MGGVWRLGLGTVKEHLGTVRAVSGFQTWGWGPQIIMRGPQMISLMHNYFFILAVNNQKILYKCRAL